MTSWQKKGGKRPGIYYLSRKHDPKWNRRPWPRTWCDQRKRHRLQTNCKEDHMQVTTDIWLRSHYRLTNPKSHHIVRYGRGCTHMNDPSHREKFWHPPLPLLSEDQLRTHYICNECGIATTSLADLQVRLDKISDISRPLTLHWSMTNQLHLHSIVVVSDSIRYLISLAHSLSTDQWPTNCIFIPLLLFLKASFENQNSMVE